MKLTNEEIYIYGRKLDEAFDPEENLCLPVKVNFYLQKNIKAIMGLAQEIEQERIKIAQSNGEYDEEKGGYKIPADKLDAVQNELNDLLNLEQEVQIYQIPLDAFDGINLTYNQVDALSFMIKED